MTWRQSKRETAHENDEEDQSKRAKAAQVMSIVTAEINPVSSVSLTCTGRTPTHAHVNLGKN